MTRASACADQTALQSMRKHTGNESALQSMGDLLSCYVIFDLADPACIFWDISLAAVGSLLSSRASKEMQANILPFLYAHSQPFRSENAMLYLQSKRLLLGPTTVFNCGLGWALT